MEPERWTRLLGTPPDQITEAEKVRRLQDVANRSLKHEKDFRASEPHSVEEMLKHIEERIEFIKEDHELDRRYPGIP